MTDAQKAVYDAYFADGSATVASINEMKAKITELVGDNYAQGVYAGMVVDVYNYVDATIDLYEDETWTDTESADPNAEDTKYWPAGYYKLTEFSYTAPEVEPEEEIVREDKVVTPMYSSDENKVVFEVYENGTAFLLNFNNYRVDVKVMINGVEREFTIGAYGYIMLEDVNA